SEVRPAEVRPPEVRLAEVRTTEVRQYEVRLAKVRLDIGIPVTPSVPGGLALLEQCDVLLVRHGSTPKSWRRTTAVVDVANVPIPAPGSRFPQTHSITSSARPRSIGGTSRPSAFAVLRLITSSYLVGCCTDKSAGFAPRRMRST